MDEILPAAIHVGLGPYIYLLIYRIFSVNTTYNFEFFCYMSAYEP